MAYAGTDSWDAEARRRRAVSLTAAVVVHLLLLLMLLRLAPPFSPKKEEPRTAVVMLPAEQIKPHAKTHQTGQSGHHAAGGRPSGVAPKPAATQPQTPAETKPWVINPEIAQFSLQASAPQVASSAPAAGTGSAGAGRGTSEGDDNGAGTGPGGQKLYRAAWYREPTDAELNTYMPHRDLPDGAWAEIACRTVPRWHVEDCVELDQSPPGSGLSRALREASFQFLVRPPRVDGKTEVGAWVRIHFDFYKRGRD